jgi:acetolactate synthase-1/2/3 large subunit
VPEDISHASHAFDEADFHATEAHGKVPAVRCRADAASIAKVARLIEESRRPLILAGGGVHLSGAAEDLAAFARAFGIPVAHTLTGKGSIPCVDPLSAGLFGRYDRIANALIETSDLLIVVGCKLGEIATKRYALPPPGKTIVHIESSPDEFDRTLIPTIRLWSDAREGIRDLHEALSTKAATIRGRLCGYGEEVIAAMKAWRAEAEERLTSGERPINVGRVMGELNQALPGNAILVADGGFAAHWSGLFYDTKQVGRGFVPDRGFASIGYGLPGAIGAALAAPDRPVFSLTGDVETARRLGLNFCIIVVNNAASGYVKALQHLMYGQGAYHASDLMETNYADVAVALGCTGIRVEDPERLGSAIREAMATPGPVVLDVVVTRDPSRMLPAADNRVVTVRHGDRVA